MVVADVTGFNPNVMLELGVRHALSKRTIIIARSDFMKEPIISDMKIYGVVDYDISNLDTIADFQSRFKKVFDKIEKEPERSDNPVFDFLSDEDVFMNKYENKQIVNRLNGVLSELAVNYDLTKRIKSGTSPVSMEKITPHRFDSESLSNLLTENYVTLEDETLARCRSLRLLFTGSNTWLNNAGNHMITKNNVPEKYVENIHAVIDAVIENIPPLVKEIQEIVKKVRKNLLTYSEPHIFIPESANEIFDI